MIPSLVLKSDKLTHKKIESQIVPSEQFHDYLFLLEENNCLEKLNRLIHELKLDIVSGKITVDFTNDRLNLCRELKEKNVLKNIILKTAKKLNMENNISSIYKSDYKQLIDDNLTELLLKLERLSTDYEEDLGIKKKPSKDNRIGNKFLYNLKEFAVKNLDNTDDTFLRLLIFLRDYPTTKSTIKDAMSSLFSAGSYDNFLERAKTRIYNYKKLLSND